MDAYIAEDTLDEQVDVENAPRNILLYRLKYEMAEGIHTYHECKCGKPTRAVLCFDCLVKEFVADGNTT
jgi:hypothetical protein